MIEQLAEKGNDFCVDEQLILGIHLRLMNGIIGDAGQYRAHGVRILGASVPLANYRKIPELIQQLSSDIQSSQVDAITLLAITHAAFEKIHPFSDDNGRTGRLIMLAQALKAGLMPPLVPKERKHAYYKYLEAAQIRDVHAPLELFIVESMKYADELLGQS